MNKIYIYREYNKLGYYTDDNGNRFNIYNMINADLPYSLSEDEWEEFNSIDECLEKYSLTYRPLTEEELLKIFNEGDEEL